MTSLYHIETICSANQWTGFLYDRDLRHERVKIAVYIRFRVHLNYSCFSLQNTEVVSFESSDKQQFLLDRPVPF